MAHSQTLLAEAMEANERRLLVLAGDRASGYQAAESVLDAIAVGIRDTVAISDRSDWICERIAVDRTAAIMGRTKSAIVLDTHDATEPNTIGRATGAVDGGGLLLLLTPDLDHWPHARDAFDEGLVVSPYELADVRGEFKRHLSHTLQTHPGIGIVDVSQDVLERSGETNPAPYRPPPRPTRPPPDAHFPAAVYDQCRTRDQSRVVHALERLEEAGEAVVIGAPRGRGKSSAAGMAAAALATGGSQVAITAPAKTNVRTLFARARAVAEPLGGTPGAHKDGPDTIEFEEGSMTYHPSDAIPALIQSGEIDVLFVDEAAGLPVPRLESFLTCDRLAFTTTVFGYEGTSQGFSHRFRDSLAAGDHRITRRQMRTPIRYARSDPIESWLTRALLLDARPAVMDLVEDATPQDVRYHRGLASSLDRGRLREVMGLLAAAHYRTEPNDLARILDAPNLQIATLRSDGAVVSAALLAREGNLPDQERTDAYHGARLHGNMLPDIFINEFRAMEPAGQPGLRIVRIATHEGARRRGLGSALLSAIREDLGQSVEWIGTGFGATPELVRFWRANDFVPILLSASKNRASGVHSVIMLDESTAALTRRFADQLPGRLRGSLSDVHREVDPDVVREVLYALPRMPSPELDDEAWRRLVTATDGPGRYDLDPEPARRLVLTHFDGQSADTSLTAREERLLVTKILQGHPWARVTTDLDYPSITQARRAVGDALGVLVAEHGGPVVQHERSRLEEDEPPPTGGQS